MANNCVVRVVGFRPTYPCGEIFTNIANPPLGKKYLSYFI